HQRLPVPAYVGDQLDALRGVHQRAAVVFLDERAPIAGLGNQFLVADVDRRLLENDFLLACVKGFVKIGADGKLGASRRDVRHPTNVGHDSLRSEKKPERQEPCWREEKSDWPIKMGLYPMWPGRPARRAAPAGR